jgi:hypothetical protein
MIDNATPTTKPQVDLRQLPHPIITSHHNTPDQKYLNTVFQLMCSPNILRMFYMHVNIPQSTPVVLDVDPLSAGRP